MVVERFSQNIINSGIFRLYIAAGFFGTMIFFVINADWFTPIEMIIGVMAVTIALKGITNMMLSLLILLFDFKNKREELDFNYHSEKIDTLINELNIQETAKASS